MSHDSDLNHCDSISSWKAKTQLPEHAWCLARKYLGIDIAQSDLRPRSWIGENEVVAH